MPDMNTMPPAGAVDDEQRKRLLDPYHSFVMPPSGGPQAPPVAPQSPIAISSPSGMPRANMAATPRPEPMAAPSQPSMPPWPLIHNPNPSPSLPNGQNVQTMPTGGTPTPVQPPAQAPELHGWRKALDVAGSLFPIGRAIENQIPGTPQNFDMKQAMSAARQDSGQKLEAGRLANVAEQQKIDQGPATADLNRRNVESEIKSREAPKPGKEEDWSVVPNVLGPNGEAVQQEKTSGQIRVVSTPGVSVKEPAPKPDSATQEDQRFESIDSAKRMGKPVSPEDKAWADAYKNRKTLGPQLNIAAMDERGKAFGRNRPTQVLDTWNGNRPVVVSSGDAEDNPDRYVTQSTGTKALMGGVTLDDISGALNNVKAASKVLDHGTVNRGVIAAVLANPSSTAASFMQSAPAGQLSPEEQDYVIALLTAREVIPGLRGLLGAGAATDSRVKLLLETLPGAQTPNSAYANKQIDSQLQTVDRVRPAIPKVSPKGNEAPAPKHQSFADWDKQH